MRPSDARMEGDRILVVVWEGGPEAHFPLDQLRASCPCAECVDEWTGEVRVRPEMFPEVTLRELEEVGNYAFKILFSDGHDTGLFSFKLLRRLWERFPAPS